MIILYNEHAKVNNNFFETSGSGNTCKPVGNVTCLLGEEEVGEDLLPGVGIRVGVQLDQRLRLVVRQPDGLQEGYTDER